MEDEEVREEDIFGLPKLSTNAEVGISFTLFILGNLLLFSVLYTTNTLAAPAVLGLLMIAVSYLFIIEAVRELEEKDHFLSRKLMNKDD
ncbi:MAG: hypothetical protein ABEJ95_06650 [Candidatus Nanohalobium sp.]